MKTQCPVESALLPFEQMQAPIMISPSMHGGVGSAAAAGATVADATVAGASGADSVAVADATAGLASDEAAGAVACWTGDVGTPGAEAQARRTPAPWKARATKETIRRCFIGQLRFAAGELAWMRVFRFGSLRVPDYADVMGRGKPSFTILFVTDSSEEHKDFQ